MGRDRTQILLPFHRYLSAIAANDYAYACGYLSAALKGQLSRLVGQGQHRGCAGPLSKLLASDAPLLARQQAQAKVTKVRMTSDQAFVVFEAPGAQLFQQTLRPDRGRWRLETIAPSVLVP